MRLWRGGINAVRRIACEGVSRTSGTLPPIQGRIGGDCGRELRCRWRSDVKDLFAVVPMDLRARDRTLVEYQREWGDRG